MYSTSPTRNLAYDQYLETAAQTRLAEQSLKLQSMQTGLMVDMGMSLRTIASTMDALRQQHENALAIQQELLHRDQVQSQMEEFIFQVEKLAAECENRDTDLPPSSRYFLLVGVVETVKQEGIGTPIIRGRDNKVAFTEALKRIQNLIDQLAHLSDVKDAIEWAEQERKKREKERRKLRQKRQAELEMLEQQREKYQTQHDELLSQRQHLKFGDWYKDKFGWVLNADYPKAKKIGIQIAMWYLGCGFIWIPIWFLVSSHRAEEQLNMATDRQVAKIVEKISSLDDQIAELSARADDTL